MVISSASLAIAKVAEQLLSDNVASGQSSSASKAALASQPVSKTPGGASTVDTVSLSPTAASQLSSQAAMEAELPCMTLVFDAMDAMTEGQTTTFSESYKPGGNVQTVATGALAGIFNQVTQTGVATVQPGETAAEQTFANEYARQLAEGGSARFYAGDDEAGIPDVEAVMSPAEKASFVSAYDSQTLSIQSAGQSPAAMTEGSTGGTMLSGDSEWGEDSGFYANISSSSLPDDNQYSFTTYSPFFGFSVISWGGPSASTAGTSPALSTVA